MTMLRTLIAVLAIGVTTAGCAPAGNSYRSTPSPEGRKATTVAVENNNWATMTVYAMRGASRHRLGMVTSMNKARFRIPSSLMAGGQELRLMADPIGSSQVYVTEAIQVRPGERVELTLQNHLAISSVSVWARE